MSLTQVFQIVPIYTIAIQKNFKTFNILFKIAIDIIRNKNYSQFPFLRNQNHIFLY